MISCRVHMFLLSLSAFFNKIPHSRWISTIRQSSLWVFCVALLIAAWHRVHLVSSSPQPLDWPQVFKGKSNGGTIYINPPPWPACCLPNGLLTHLASDIPSMISHLEGLHAKSIKAVPTWRGYFSVQWSIFALETKTYDENDKQREHYKSLIRLAK